ncbi:AbrB family transcriptional regulator [Archaeoglobales archaeon]|nr:MAG: AbrB family transcriptional regulator [Archaeoglobales archaeon]
MVDGQTTSLTRANKTSQSLRTTVPMGIIKQFGLKEGDKLLWRLDVKDNKLVIVIEPVKVVEAEVR